MFNGENQYQRPGCVTLHIGLHIVAVREILRAKLPEAAVLFGFILKDVDASETNDAPYVVPPVSRFLLRLVYDGEARLVIGTDGVQFVAFHRTVEKELSLLVQEVDGEGRFFAEVEDVRDNTFVLFR